MNLEELLEEYSAYFSYMREDHSARVVYELDPLPVQINTFSLDNFESKIVKIFTHGESQVINRTYFVAIFGILEDNRYFYLNIRVICGLLNEFHTELYLSKNIGTLLNMDIVKNNLSLLIKTGNIEKI